MSGQILIQPSYLRTTARNIASSAEKIGNSIMQVDNIIQTLGPIRFEGNRAEHLRNRYNQQHPLISTAPQLIKRYSEQLTIIANRFDIADARIGESFGKDADPPGQYVAEYGRRDGSSGMGMTYSGGMGMLAVPALMAAVRLEPGWSQSLPSWLREWLDRSFPPVMPLQIETPTGMPAASDGKTPFGRLLEDLPREEFVPAAAVSDNGIQHNVPLKSQGALYGNAACAPTAISMVLDYYHASDAANPTRSIEDIKNMFDKGEFTTGRGISLNRVVDELQNSPADTLDPGLGYANTSLKYGQGVSFNDLETSLKDGPVIVNAAVGLQNSPRAITGPGNTNHAMVVTGISTDSETVMLNDPWTGQALTFERGQFDKMWSKGQNAILAIRP
jgi:uncharacterized protein YukE/uncharacterized protein YvpB